VSGETWCMVAVVVMAVSFSMGINRPTASWRRRRWSARAHHIAIAIWSWSRVTEACRLSSFFWSREKGSMAPASQRIRGPRFLYRF
jgi:hypothetical protein